MAEHKPGTMDISEKEKTFSGFIKTVTRIAMGIFVLLILLALVNA